MKCYFTILVLVLLYSVGQSQNIENKPNKLKALAESAEIDGDYYSAIYYYELFYKIKPKVNTLNKLAHLYYNTREYEKAKNTFLKIAREEKNNSLLFYHAALSYKQLGKYDSCIYYFDKCEISSLNKYQKKIRKNEYSGALIATDTKVDTNTVYIHHLNKSINGMHMESAPEFINDSLIIYTSQLVNDSNKYLYYDTVTVPVSNLFYAQKINSNWIKTNKKINLNHQFSNIGNSCFSLNKRYFYFTNTTKNWHKKNISQLYVSEFKNGKFNNPVKLDNEINNMFFSSTQPTVGTTFNTDIEIIYYSSDRPGGKGGMDIWYIVFNKKRGTYGQPINAGSRINTQMNEITPYYDNTSKTLYYSSNGLIGFGGYDIYKTIGELRSWIKPINIGNYINSNADEIYFKLNYSRSAGFIASNRPVNINLPNNYCCFDLFYFTFKNPDQLIIRGNLLTKLNPIIDELLKNGVEFRDTVLTNNYLSDAIVSIYLKTDMGNDSLYISSDTTDSEGVFRFNVGNNQDYTIIIHDDDEIKAQTDISTKGQDNRLSHEIVLDFDPIETLPDIPLVIKNIYYDFGKSNLNDNAKKRLNSTLVKLLQEITDINIEISSHTDNVGDSDYNMTLSEQRAKKVSAYIESCGINKERIITKGYGERYPIAPNQNNDGSNNIIGMEQNRRTEFRIIGKTQSFEGL